MSRPITKPFLSNWFEDIFETYAGAGCINAVNQGMPAGAKALDLWGLYGTTEVVP
jgi:hypothetical protein